MSTNLTTVHPDMSFQDILESLFMFAGRRPPGGYLAAGLLLRVWAAGAGAPVRVLGALAAGAGAPVRVLAPGLVPGLVRVLARAEGLGPVPAPVLAWVLALARGPARAVPLAGR
jgi:hypothetical protein